MKNLFWFTCVIVMLSASCKKDDKKVDEPDHDHNESEVITTVQLVFSDSTSGAKVGTFTFKDPDGDGGISFTKFDTISLSANSTYLVDLVLLNEAAQPAGDISKEVLEEGKDHLVCYTTASTGLSVERTDKDANGLQIGLKSKWKTKTNEKGKILVSLKHQPGIKTGDCGKGETDVEVDFPFVVK